MSHATLYTIHMLFLPLRHTTLIFFPVHYFEAGWYTIYAITEYARIDSADITSPRDITTLAYITLFE